MRILLVTDAWTPQINGVVVTLQNTMRWLERWGHEVHVISPQGFRTFPMPTYPEIPLAIMPGREVSRRIREFDPDAVHIATEGPLGGAARAPLPEEQARVHDRVPHLLSRVREAALRRAARHHLRLDAALPCALLGGAGGHARIRELLEAPRIRATWSTGRAASTPSSSIRSRSASSSTRGPSSSTWAASRSRRTLPAFLSLDLPGTKLVVGDGPQRKELERDFPDAVFVGAKTGAELATYYQRADVFVFPSRTDTFGLVLVEAMACGTPVAAFPVRGPIDVIKDPAVGVLDNDLGAAALAALTLDREKVRRYGERFSWEHSSRQFLASLVPARGQGGVRCTSRLSSPRARSRERPALRGLSRRSSTRSRDSPMPGLTRAPSARKSSSRRCSFPWPCSSRSRRWSARC